MKRRSRNKRTKKANLYGTSYDSGCTPDNILEHLVSNGRKLAGLIPVLEAFGARIGESAGRLTLTFK